MSSATKVPGIVLVVLSVPLLLGFVVLKYSTSEIVPSFVQDDRDLTGFTLLGIGVVCLLVGILLTVLRRKPKPQAVVAPPPPQAVEIKRTEMNFAGTGGPSVSDELQARLDTVNQKMGRLKVQYGMGEVSNESYKRLIAEYEAEKAVVEREIMERSQG